MRSYARYLWPFLLIFLFLPFFFKKDHIEHFKQTRPSVPAPITSHPWIAQQQLSDVSIEMVRDIEKLELFCSSQKEDLTPVLMRTLLALQAEIPFRFPSELYNVLCIGEPKKKGRFPYTVYKRVYFGDTKLGMPMYFDVRVFNVDEHEVSQIVNWHFETIQGEFQQCGKGFFGHGSYKDEDLSHGFAPKRAFYILSHFKEGHLYVLYSDVPFENADQLWQIVGDNAFL